MSPWIAVALGSALGGMARYGVSRLWPWVPGGWPMATMTVNVLGSFAIGLLSVVVAGRAGGAEAARLFWMTGVLGGFTTYSAFALETVTLAGAGETMRAAAYVVATVLVCLVAAFVGRAIGMLIAGD